MKKHIMVEIEQALRRSREEDEEEEQLEEGPPPGFQFMPSLQLQQQKQEHMDQDDDGNGGDDDDDGNGDDSADYNDDDDDDGDDEAKGPPPGFSTPPAVPLDIPSVKPNNNLDDMEDEDGPPPGWQFIPRPNPPLPSSSAVPSDTEMRSSQKDIRDNGRIPPLGSQSTYAQESSKSEHRPSSAAAPPSAIALTSEIGNIQGGAKGGNQGPQFMQKSGSPSRPSQPTELSRPHKASPLSGNCFLTFEELNMFNVRPAKPLTLY